MKVELSRFRVKPGKSARVDEWLEMLNENMAEVLQTLEREQMKFEVIFREMIDGEEYLYWFSVQGESGQPMGTSPFEIDQKHIEFQKECLDAAYGMRDAQPQVIMAPEAIAKIMEWDHPADSAVKFQRRELIHRRKQTDD